jgi:hypothetical protein
MTDCHDPPALLAAREWLNEHPRPTAPIAGLIILCENQQSRITELRSSVDRLTHDLASGPYVVPSWEVIRKLRRILGYAT